MRTGSALARVLSSQHDVLALCCGLLLAIAPAAAQPVNPVQSLGGATIPQSNEAALLSSQAQQALQLGDYRLALELIDRLGRLQDGLVPAPGARTCYPPWRERMRILRMLPPGAVEHFRARYDAEVRGRLNRAIERNDVSELQQLFQGYPSATDWPRVGAELANRLLDRGDYAAALEVLNALVAEHPTPELLAQQAVGLISLNAATTARSVLDRLATSVAGAGQVWEQRVALLRTWLERRRGRSEPPDIGLALDADANWSLVLSSGRTARDDALSDDSRLVDAVEQFRRLPTLWPVYDNGLLFMRARGQIWAIDAATLTVRWSASERRAAQIGRGQAFSSGGPTRASPNEAELLLTHPLRYSIVAGQGCVFTVESLTLYTGHEPEPGWQAAYWGPAPNVLVARKQSTGDVLWELGADPREALSNVTFQDAPVLAAGNLCVPAQRGDDLILVQVNPVNGSVLRTVPVIGPPTYFPPAAGRCLVVADDSTVFVATGNGVVTAFDARNLEWKWAAPYESLLASMRGRRWWNRVPENAPDMGYDRPVLAEDLLIVAPADSESILAFDRFDGRQRWPGINRAPYQSVLGVSTAGLLLAGNGVTCIDVRDGRSIIWQTAPLELIGRPVLQHDRVYVPLRDGLAVVDATTGKLLDDPRGISWTFGADLQESSARRHSLEARRLSGAALCVDETSVYAFSPHRVAKFPDPSRLGGSNAKEQAAPADRLALAWQAYLEKRPEDALNLLEGVSRGGAELASAAEQLLVHTFVALSQQASSSADRLAWLRRAEKLSLSETASGRLSLLVGEALEQAGDVAAAREHYSGLLSSAGDVLVPSPDDVELHVPIWLLAGTRLAQLWPELDEAERQSLLQAALPASNAARLGLLSRWRWFLETAGDQHFLTELSVRIASGPSPSELSCALLPNIEATEALPRDQRRRIALERWACATARGDLAEARALRAKCADWLPEILTNAESAATGWSIDSLPARAQAVARDFSKLEQDQTDAFDGAGAVLRWKRGATDLLLDDDGNAEGFARFVVLMNREQRRVELVNVHTGETWRVHPAVLAGARPDMALEEAMRLFNMEAGGDGPRMIRGFAHRDGRGVVAVNGGIFAFGLWGYGSEQKAGARFWEFPITLAEIDSTLSSQVVLSDLGCYVRTSDGRLSLYGWSDGRRWWSRELGRREVSGMVIFESKLIVTTTDQSPLVLDAASGVRLPEWEERFHGAQNVEACASRVLAIHENEMRAYGADGKLAWAQSYQNMGGYVIDSSRTLIAINDHVEGGWTLYDCDKGQAHTPAEMGQEGEVVLIARDGDAIMTVASGALDDAPFVQINRYDASTWELTWSRQIINSAVPHVSQLVGNPKCIVLLTSPVNQEPETSLQKLTLEIYDKQSGLPLSSIPAGQAFGPETPTSSEPVLFVTPTRILLQINDEVAAWGRSSWGD